MYPGYNVIINTILAFVRLRNSICSQFKAGPDKSRDYGDRFVGVACAYLNMFTEGVTCGFPELCRRHNVQCITLKFDLV